MRSTPKSCRSYRLYSQLMNNLLGQDFYIEDSFKIDEKSDSQKYEILERKEVEEVQSEIEEELLKPPDVVFNEGIELQKVEYVRHEKFEVLPEDYIKEQKFLPFITNKIYKTIPMKRKDYGMVKEDNKKNKKFDGYAEKMQNLSTLTRKNTGRSSFVSQFSLVSKKTTRSYIEEELRKSEKDKNRDKDINKYMENELDYRMFKNTFFNSEKFNNMYNEFLASKDAKEGKNQKKKQKQGDSKRKRNKMQKMKDSAAGYQAEDSKVSARKIKIFDEETQTKLFNDWSGSNVLRVLNDDTYSVKNNEIMIKMAEFDVILWKKE